MVKLDFNFDPIKYLVSRRYPNWQLPPPSLSSVANADRAIAQREMQDEARAYEQELQSKTPEEIAELLKTEMEAHAQETRRKEEAEENRRFFNWPTAKADFSHWGKLSYWSLDEAVAVSFGRAPESVNLKTVEPHASVSPSPFNTSAVENSRITIHGVK